MGSACRAATLVPDLPAAYRTNEYFPFHDGDTACAPIAGVPATEAVTATSTATTRNLGRIGQ
ncbi:hypothetical protein MMARJ_49060 [Mycobacterium marseillense]|uniref:Uncharacterized protein n=1 Tax=Mycobacterium marseillense TaxID=701042 RepID=A0ABN5ZZ10_9MYCO|nr:hypothetical protein MMARJ_49060 [Mycobacterium marseillense]